jgi:hypothetical protein
MSRIRRLWAPVLAALLVSVLLGAPGRDDEAIAVAPRVTTANLMIPAAAFAPADPGIDYTNAYGSFLEVFDPGIHEFGAAVFLPVPVANIKRITLYAYDNSGTYDACARVYRKAPADDEVSVSPGAVCTEGGSEAYPQAVTTTALSPRQINASVHGLILWVTLGAGTRVFGVKVTYSS